MYANSPKGFKHWAATIFTVILTANTLHTMTVPFRDIPDVPIWDFAVGASFIFMLFHLWLSLSVLRAVSKENSVAAEILFDAKAFTTALTLKDKKAALVFANSFLVMYLPVFPYAIFTLIKYRKCLTTALDPRVLVRNPDPENSIAYLIHRLLLKNYKESVIPQDIIDEHFVLAGDTYFIKDKKSASFLRLSYSEQDLLHAFGIDKEEVFSTMVELSMPGYGSMDDSMTDAAIKAAFRVC